MPNLNILIVEDEWIIYEELADFLKNKGFEICPYTKSYDQAIQHVEKYMPRIVLLDIHLQGIKDGIELGETLFSTYKIPFIYLSAFTDDVTIDRARETSPDTFLIKTKPIIDKQQLYASIKMSLSKAEAPSQSHIEGIFVYSDYYRDAKEFDSNGLRKLILHYEEITYIETDTEKRNYLLIHTNTTTAFLKTSLTNVKMKLPYYFVRINAHQIINLQKVCGKTNNTTLLINNKKFRIGPTFSKEVHKVLHGIYLE